MEDPWTMKGPEEEKISKRQQANADVFRKLCRGSDVYVDETEGVVLTPGPQERSPKQPINYWKAIAWGAALLAATALLVWGGRSLVSKLEAADKAHDTHIQNTYPREPYRGNN